MDKNTIIGFGLMGLVLVAFTWLTRPSKEQLEAQQRYNDSIARVEAMTVEAEMVEQAIATTALDSVAVAPNDSLAQQLRAQVYGIFAGATMGNNQQVTLSNDSLQLTFATRGGMLSSSELKGYKDHKGDLVRFIQQDGGLMAFTFVTPTNRVISTADLYFTPQQIDERTLRMSAATDMGGELAFVYTLRDKYRLDMAIETKGLQQIVSPNQPDFDVQISLPLYQNEKSHQTENRYAGFAYEHSSGDVEKLNTNKEVTEEVSGSVKWIAYRDMFFSMIVYSQQALSGVSLKSTLAKEENILKHLDGRFVLPLDMQRPNLPAALTFYLGPNDYTLLKALDKEMGDRDTHFAHIVDMGDWFRFINVYLVIPVFKFLEKIFSNYGLIILLLTLFIKLLLTPFTWKSFLSQAKMRVLRPQVEEINQKYPGEDQMMQRQRATMELYKRAGASSMGGCLPMLLQMPFLVAMYQYFPTSINLRGESFLWAADLSTYDDIIRLPFEIPLVGSHISLFCLLMTVVQVIYMKISQSGQPQAPGMAVMKYMPYMMSVMLFVFLNQAASGLSYYYLLSMLISIVQTGVFRMAINEKKLLAQMEENKKKPIKKSKFMQRLEEMQHQQMELQKQQERK